MSHKYISGQNNPNTINSTKVFIKKQSNLCQENEFFLAKKETWSLPANSKNTYH